MIESIEANAQGSSQAKNGHRYADNAASHDAN